MARIGLHCELRLEWQEMRAIVLRKGFFFEDADDFPWKRLGQKGPDLTHLLAGFRACPEDPRYLAETTNADSLPCEKEGNFCGSLTREATDLTPTLILIEARGPPVPLPKQG
jgi:hypothetical protein